MRIISRRVGNLSNNFGVSRTFCSRRIDIHLSDASRDLATLTLEITALLCDADFVLRLCTKFEIRRPSRSEDIRHLLCEH